MGGDSCECSDERQSHSLGFKLRSAREVNSNKHRSRFESLSVITVVSYCKLVCMALHSGAYRHPLQCSAGGRLNFTVYHTSWSSADHVVSSSSVHGGDPMARNRGQSHQIRGDPSCTESNSWWFSRDWPLSDARRGAHPGANSDSWPTDWLLFLGCWAGLGCRIYKSLNLSTRPESEALSQASKWDRMTRIEFTVRRTRSSYTTSAPTSRVAVMV